MAQELHLSAIAGLTVTAQLFVGIVAATPPLPCTELGSTGEYYASVPAGTPANTYLVVFMAGTAEMANGILLWDGLREVVVPPPLVNAPGSYVTVADVVQAFGMRELNMLADRNQDGVYEPDVVQSHILEAEQQINFAIAQRCQLPLLAPSVEILGRIKQWALDITRYRLTGSSGVTVTSDVDARYKEAKDDLDRVTSGKIILCAQSSRDAQGNLLGNGLQPNNLTAGEAESEGCCRQWDAGSLRDFLRPRLNPNQNNNY